MVLDSIMLDNQALITYIKEHLNGIIGVEYSDPYGEGRIIILQWLLCLIMKRRVALADKLKEYW